MPANVVKKGEEPIWNKAKAAAAKTKKKDVGDLSDDDYALVNHIFQKMKGTEWSDKECDNAIASFPGKKKECRENSVRLIEFKNENGKTFVPCVIISQGLGNLRDKNYYTGDAIKSGAMVYEGKQAYYDHPTPSQESEQPGRSVNELAGHYEDCRAVMNDGVWELRANFVPEDDPKIISKVKHAIEYKKKYPDKDYVGISINGDGEGETMEYDKFLESIKPTSKELEKIRQVEGQDINVITKLTDAFSADFVTAAGAGGRVLKEQKSNQKRSSKMGAFAKAMKQFFMGVEENDKEKIDAAVKSLREDDGETHEDETHQAEAEKMHQALVAAKKEGKKYEGESEAEYEKRMLAAAIKAMKKKESEDEDEKKESEDEDEKKEGDDGKEPDADDKKDDKKEKKEDEDEDEKKEMKQMKKEMAAMRAELVSLKEEKSEESAKLKMKLEGKERKEKVDKLLAESGLPRWVTDHMRPVIESQKTEEGMKKVIGRFKEFHTEHLEREFSDVSKDGFAEHEGDKKTAGKNDDLF